GPALREGASYSLVIEEGWPSANGGQKAPRYAHPYTVTSALRTLPDIQLWQFDTPGLGTLEPLRITFDRPFDHQLLQSSIRVSDEGGQLVSGTISVSDHEKNWAFRPDQPWASKSLQVIVDARLEDTAGNNFRDLLDHVQTENAQTPSLLTHTLHLKSLPE
ncbi:MAG: Ig-like domain-containing protein, partial [Roseobacter sp.]